MRILRDGWGAVRSLLDERLDELAASAHQGAGARTVITIGVGAVTQHLIGLQLAATWVALMLAFEAWSWFATRPQFLRERVSLGQRANHLANFCAETTGWFTIGWLNWRTGLSQGELCGAIIWLSQFSFAQSFAYQTPLGFVVGGFLPALAMLTLTLLPPHPPGLPLVWSTLLLAAVFIVGGARQTMEARRRYAEVQQRLARSEAQYRVLADNVTDVIALTGVDGARHYISPSIEQALGYKVDDLLVTPNYTYLHPEDREMVAAAVASLTPQDNRRTLEYRVIRKDGGVTWAETCFTLAPGAAPDGADEIVTASRAIDARKAMEAELVEARLRAEAAAAAKADFLANMTHELRTPLNAIVGFSGLLTKSDALRGQDARHAQLVSEASETLLELVNSVLDLSRIDAGAVELDPQPFVPATLVEAAAAMVGSQAETKGLRLTVASHGANERLLGDSIRIRQVLLNLLSNALKFTVEGGVEVAATVSGAGDRRSLRVEVRDTGVGVPADRTEQVFDRFAQADASVSRKFGGTGLGLAISKRIIELMGGEIGVASVEGEGSTFWFQLDLPAAEAPPVDSAIAAELAPTGPDRRLRLLLVEDVPVNRELVHALLSPFEIEIDDAANGAEALAAVRRASYDLILMDVQMPVMDGLTATRRIRAQGLTAAPIVAMTANVLPEQIERCRVAGMNDHLGKPISPARLLETIARWSEGVDAEQPRLSDASAA